MLIINLFIIEKLIDNYIKKKPKKKKDNFNYKNEIEKDKKIKNMNID